MSESTAVENSPAPLRAVRSAPDGTPENSVWENLTGAAKRNRTPVRESAVPGPRTPMALTDEMRLANFGKIILITLPNLGLFPSVKKRCAHEQFIKALTT